MSSVSSTLIPVPPYDFVRTVDYLTYSRGRYVSDVFEQGTFRRLLDLDGLLALAAVRSEGSVESPRLTMEIEGKGLSATSAEAGRRTVAWILGTDERLEPFYAKARCDPVLAPVVQELRGLHLPHTASVFEALVLAILAQQISIQVAHILRAGLVEAYGVTETRDGTAYHAFPRPERLVEAGVDGPRAIKFSARKAEYILEIAQRVASGDLELEGLRASTSAEAVEALTSIRGVGPWTAQWLLIRSLGHGDGFPSGDLAMQRFLGQVVNGGRPMSADEALDYSLRWSPYRSYATTYLFAAARAGLLGSIHPAQAGP